MKWSRRIKRTQSWKEPVEGGEWMSFAALWEISYISTFLLNSSISVGFQNVRSFMAQSKDDTVHLHTFVCLKQPSAVRTSELLK